MDAGSWRADRLLPARRMTIAVLVGAAAVGLAARLIFGLAYWNDRPLTRDEQEYLSLSRSLAAGRGFVYDNAVSDPFGRAPGYPFVLSLIGGGGSAQASVPTPVKVAQAVIGALGVLLAGGVAWQLGGHRMARAAAIIASIYLPLVWVSAYALSEALFWPLALGIAWLFDAAYASRGPRAAGTMAAAGLLAGGATLVRPGLMLFVLPAAAWLVWRRRPVLAAVLVAGAAVVVAPWSIQTSRHHQRFVLVTTEGGVTFWIGNHPLARGEGDFAANPDLRRSALALRARYPTLTEEQMEPVYYREAIGWIGSHPIDWLTLEARKLFYLLVPVGPSYRLHSTRYRVASVVSYGLILPAGLLGLVRLGSRRGTAPGLWLLAGSALLACLVFFPQERFRIPILDPTLVVAAGGLALGGRRGGTP